MNNHHLSLDNVFSIAFNALSNQGCNEDNATAIANTIYMAERDGCRSHGLFRLPGYVASLQSGKVDGAAKPSINQLTPAVLKVDAHNGYAPLALLHGRDKLVECAKQYGIAAMNLVRAHHFSALWIEIEALTEKQLSAIAFTAYTPSVAPAGGTSAFYGTNPMAFGWPRVGKPPMVFDQATAMQARGEVMIAARDGHTLPDGVGIDADGNPTNDPNEILKGCLLPFGGYKGASIALMIELLVGPLLGERCSFEASAADNKDGGPPRGGELIIAIDPTKFNQTADPFAHAERLFCELLNIEGTRLPGQRRVQNRQQIETDGIEIPHALYEKIQRFIG